MWKNASSVTGADAWHNNFFLNILALGKLGNIVVETFVILDVSSNVSLFAHPWKHCCGNKICFPRSRNVS
jgi:hypothetical protein